MCAKVTLHSKTISLVNLGMAEMSKPANQSNEQGTGRPRSILMHPSEIPTSLRDSQMDSERHKFSASVSVSQYLTQRCSSEYRVVSYYTTLAIPQHFPGVRGPCTAVEDDHD